MRGLLAACLVLAGAAAAEDADPAQRHSAAVRRFGAPTKRGSFRFEGEMFIDGKPQGTCLFAAEPDCLPEKPGVKSHWRVNEFTQDALGKKLVESSAYLAKDLRAVSGKTDRGGQSVAWRRAGKEYEATVTSPDGAATKHAFAADPLGTATVAGAILFTRLAWPLDGRYSGRILVDGVERSDITWNFQGPATWCGAKAVVVSCRVGGVATTVALHPETRDVLGLAIRGPSMTLWCRAKGLALVPPGRDPLLDLTARNATSPIEAATQASLWLFSKDKALGRRCIHWPTVFDKFLGSMPAMGLTVEKFRERYLDEALKQSPPDLTETRRKLLLDQMPDAHVTMPDARTALVRFGNETARPTKVIEVDGRWYWLVPGADG